MNFKKSFLLVLLIVLILGISTVSANEVDDINSTSVDDSSDEIIEVQCDDSNEGSDVVGVSPQEPLDEGNRVIVVNNWDELQYYCSLSDKDYTLKLKENTNFYPTNPDKPSYKIVINNNVKIIGSPGAYFGDVCQRNAYIKNGHYVMDDGKAIAYTAIIVPDNYYAGLTLENVTFKWIYTKYNPDGVFLQMGGKSKNVIKNCIFENINTMVGHSCIVYLKKGDALLENCSFVNCTTDFGCVSLYDPNSYTSARMTVKDCYFENNFARTEPGCINNCAILTVYNTTFYKNRAGVWAGAIHTHFYASATIYDSNFTDNVAGWNGGALYTYSYLNIYNTVFSGNNCTTNNGGGAIGACKHVSPPHIYIENSLFENNENLCWGLDELSTSGTGRGGAISLMDDGSLEVRNTTFISNAASIGTAICAVEAGSYGSPGVIIVNNTFINHTRAGDVLRISLAGTISNISDNVYIGNSIVFSNLTLTTLNAGKEQSTLQINISLANPSYYDVDILDKTLYDVYINNKYVKTVNSTVFTLDFGDLDICNVYVVPTISNRKSNEVTLISTREYIFVSKSNGNDSNNGLSRDAPVSTIKRALELAQSCQNIILLDGDYSESNVQIDYDVCIKGEGNATLTGETSFTGSSVFVLKNLKINNLNSGTFITQNGNNLLISNCIFTNNRALLVYNSGFTSISDSILLNNSKIINNINNCVLDYNWWGNTVPDLNISKFATLNLTSDVSALENNQKANIKAVFYLNDGSKYTNLPNINLDISSINGIINKNITGIDENVIYTLTAFSDGILTASYNEINVSKTFEFLKSNPSISLTSNDIMFGDNLTITIATPADAEGNLTVNVGNASQTKAIESSKTVFTFENLKADAYTITLTYTGDKKYLSKELASNVNVNKYESTTMLSIGTVNVGEDVILTITITDSSTGNVTLKINNDVQTLALNDSKANYTIKNIKRGDYLITAIYNGDEKYFSSQDSRFIEVDNLNATVSITIDDIVYGNTALVQVTLNGDATGSVSATVDGITNVSEVRDGKAIIKLANLEAGVKDGTVFYTGDDTYFNKTLHADFTIRKAELTFEIMSGDVMIGQDAHVYIKVPAKTTGTFTIGEDIITIPMSGFMDYVISGLEIGEYEITAVYNGNNYNTVANSTSFSVLEYQSPQWQNEGFDSQNTGQSSYNTTVNGQIAYVITIDDEIVGNLVIDSMGNLYVATQSTIYSIDSNGNLRWNYSSESLAGNFSGLSIGRDVVVSPSAGDTLYFINQTDGSKYGSSNIYQASSLFAPIMDSSANIYIASEYQYDTNSYKLVKVPYRSWEFGGELSLVDLGNVRPLVSPTVGDDLIVVLCEGRLRVLDAKTLQTKFIKAGNYAAVRPVIGEGNIVYAVLGDSVVAYTVSGSQLWKTKLTGGVGDMLVMDCENGLYATNSKGNLYRYDIATGKESLISNLEITSGILVGNNGDLYFAVNDTFYAISFEGRVLWKSVLGSVITGTPVIDKNGTIYVAGKDNRVYALTRADLKDPKLSVSIENETLMITIDNQATGDVSFTLNGEKYTNVFNKSVLGVTPGDYQINVTYSGDARFESKSVLFTFTVKNALKGANVVMAYSSGAYYKVRLTQNGIPLEGKSITFNINGKKTTVKSDVDGYASVKIDLAPKTYTVTAAYGRLKVSNKVTVKSIITAKNVNAKKSAKTLKIQIILKKVNNKYLKNKQVTLKFNKKTYKVKTNSKGVATFTIKSAAYKSLKIGKKYAYQVTYGKDTVKKTIKFKK